MFKLSKLLSFLMSSPSIMFYALCQYQLPDNEDIHGAKNCEHKELEKANQILVNEEVKEVNKKNDILSYLNITKIQAYFVIGLFLMILLLIGLVLILKTRFSSANNRSPENKEFEVC